jgi:hypothetical protein
LRNKLLVFGDSWPYGEELLPGEKTFGEILSNQLDIKFENHSQPMTSVAHMLLQLKSAIENLTPADNPVAIFCITSISRSIRFSGTWEEIQVARSDPASRAYYQHIHSDNLDELMVSSHILALQNMCRTFGILDYYVSCWALPKFLLPGVDQSRVYSQTMLEMLDSRSPDTLLEIFSKCQYISGCHPNQQGHIKIANTFLPWIDVTQ